MAEFSSEQYAKYEGVEGVNVNEWGGRVRMVWYNVTQNPLALNDTVKLARIPAKARVLHGRLAHSAAGTGATLDIGVKGGAEDKYAAALAIAVAGEKDYANTLALNMGSLTTSEEVIVAKFEGADPTDPVTLKGYLMYVID